MTKIVTRDVAWLRSRNACSDGTIAVSRAGGLDRWWRGTDRVDWMMWLAARTGMAGAPETPERRQLALMCADVAEYAIQYVTDEHVAAVCTATVQTVRAWACGEATTEDLRSAADAADAAAAAAAAARSKKRDEILSDYAERVVRILVDMKAPGCQWLYITENGETA